MTRANYGIYGTVGFFVFLVLVALVSLVIVIFNDYLRPLFATTFVVSLAVLFLVPAIFARSRKKTVREIVEAGRIKPNHFVLDVGTGRGFPAIKIAKAVPLCSVIGIDIWDKPAKGQFHKGFILGNTKENAEKNAVLEGVQGRVEFRQCDAREMPFESETFDVVVSFAAIHQMVYFGRDGDRVLVEIHRVLKKGGRFVDVDPMVGQRIVDKLQELGFIDIELKNLKMFPSFLKMLTATKD